MIAIHVLPSGPIPWRDHLLAISALRFEERRVTGRFSTLVRPVRRPGKYALEALSRDAADFDDSPAFAAIEPELRAFLSSDVIVGFGIKVTLEFLAAELSRINVSGLENDSLELADLASERGVHVRKPGLDHIASALQLSAISPGNPDATARLTAQVAARLLVRPVGTDEGAPPSTLPDRWALLDPSRVRSVAETPGVYLFRGRAGDVLYAGSSGNLRRRLASYQSRPLELERRLEGLAERVWEIETHPSEGYLEALIDEARFISAHAPPFNVQRKVRMPRRFLRASTAPPAGIRAVAGVLADGASYLGPFASASLAGQALSLARAVFPELGGQRRVTSDVAESKRRRSVAQRAQEQLARAQAVRDALRLLSGQRELALQRVGDRTIAAANDGNFREVERLRQLRAAIVSFEITPSPLRDGPDSRFAVAMLDASSAPRLVYHLASGNILERRELDDSYELEGLIGRWYAETPRVVPNPDAFPPIMRWLALQGKRCAVIELPPCAAVG
jgi:DNA polymerase III epsilon subunit-like protein